MYHYSLRPSDGSPFDGIGNILLVGINAQRLSVAYGGTVLRNADKSLYRKNALRFLVVLRL
ncbi:MAG: hypothetical protein LBN42_02685 [Oscillospiraceae bacterium]|nr:hypothetical protein [Oscillospiraceae bacterium]